MSTRSSRKRKREIEDITNSKEEGTLKKKPAIMSKLPPTRSTKNVKTETSPRKSEVSLNLVDVKKESEIDENDEEENNYESLRKKNIEDNIKFLSKIGVFEAKQQLSNVTKSKKTREASQRGLKKKKEEVLQVRRKSLRLARIDPEGNNLPDAIVEDASSNQPRMPPECPVEMVATLLDPEDQDYHKQMSCTIKSTSKIKPDLTPSLESFVKNTSKMTLGEKGVAKVVPSRIFSLTFHPITEKIIVAAGGKWGGVGLWDVESQDDKEGVVAYKPHISPVNWLSFHQDYPALIYSCSYDGTFRYGDFNTNQFHEIYSSEDAMLRNVDFLTADTMVVSQSDGNVAIVDRRTPGVSAENMYHVSEKPLRTVSVHPDGRYFCTGSLDATVKVWDLRHMKVKNNKCISEGRHNRVVNSAYFSPVTGKHVLSVSDDNTIHIYDVNENREMKLRKSVRHNNHTGRWLTKFRGVWHPTREDVFIMGSMDRPRRIEMFSADGILLKTFQSEDYLGSVCSLNAFHPTRNILAGANSSGRVHVFM